MQLDLPTIQMALLIGFLVSIVVQAIERLTGTVITILWCLAGIAYGFYADRIGIKLEFVGRHVPVWIFVAFMIMLIGYNIHIVRRLLRVHRRDAGHSS